MSPKYKRKTHAPPKNSSTLEMKAVELKFMVRAKADGHGRAHFYSKPKAQLQELGLHSKNLYQNLVKRVQR